MYGGEWSVLRVVWCEKRYETRRPTVSSLVFNFVDILSQMIPQSKCIHRLKTSDEELPMSQFAEDTTFYSFLDVQKESFCSFFFLHTFQPIALISGLKINYDKTMVVWIGSQRNRNVKFMPELNFNWNPVSFRILGVVFLLMFMM